VLGRKRSFWKHPLTRVRKMIGKVHLRLLPEIRRRKGKPPHDAFFTHHAECQPSGYRQKSREESNIDADIDDLLEADVTRDSIVDSEEEEDDVDEVNSILASDEEP
jgi:hypothetical protein